MYVYDQPGCVGIGFSSAAGMVPRVRVTTGTRVNANAAPLKSVGYEPRGSSALDIG